MNQQVMEWALRAVASWVVVCVFFVSAGFSSVAQANALAWDSHTKAWFGDVNGDGLTDVLLQPKHSNPTLTFGQADTALPLDTLNTLSLPALFAASESPYDWSQQQAIIQLLDVNGDGLSDIFVWHPEAQRAWVFTGHASSPVSAAAPMTDFQTFDFTSPHQTLSPDALDAISLSFDIRLTVIDSNHDGADDLFIQRIDGFAHHLLRSTDAQLSLFQSLPYHTV